MEHFKAFLAGVFVTLAIFATASAWAQQSKPIASTPAVQSTNQRWLIYQHPTFRADQFLLDTVTGKVYNQVSMANSPTMLWHEMDKIK